MQGLYYLVMLIGVAWLVAWTVAPPDFRRRVWWPFDLRTADTGDEADPDDPSKPHAATRNDGRRNDPSAAAPADPQQPVSQSGGAKSWRVRREQAQASADKRRG